MDQKFDIASFNTQFPNPSGNGGDKTNNGAGVTPSRQSFFSFISPRPEIPTTYRPMETHNFIPGQGISRTVSKPAPVSFMDLNLPLASPSPSSFGDSPVPAPAPVANFTVGLPPLPPRRGNSVRGSGSGQPPRKTHIQTNSVILSELAENSLLAEISPEQIYPKPVGVNTETGLVVGENQSGGNKRTAGVKRRAGKDIAPPSRHTRSVSLSTCFDGERSVPVEPYDLFTESELEQIVDSEKLTELAQKDPRVVKRILANRQAAARSKDKKAKYLVDLENKVEELKMEFYGSSVRIRQLESDNMKLDTANRELRARLQRVEEEAARLRDNGVMAINLLITLTSTDSTVTTSGAVQDG